MTKTSFEMFLKKKTSSERSVYACLGFSN